MQICVTLKKFIGCKKSLHCVLKVPYYERIPRSVETPPSLEKPLEDLLQNCGHQQNVESNAIVGLCSEKMWDMLYTIGYSEGEATLKITLQGNIMVREKSYI